MKQTPNRSAEENNNRSIESVEKIHEDKTLKKQESVKLPTTSTGQVEGITIYQTLETD